MKKTIFLLCLMAFISVSNFAADLADDGLPISRPATTFMAPFATGSLTTHFLGGNGYAGNTFDIIPTANLQIEALDVHEDYLGAPTTVEVYYKTGTSVGFENTPSAWTLLGAGSAIGAGLGLPTYLDLAGNNITFQAGQTYGFVVFFTSYAAGTSRCRYTNGGPGTVYSNSDLTITTQNGLATPIFGGTVFSGREWNGTIYYTSGGLDLDEDEISAASGGVVNFTMAPGAIYSGSLYLLLGSVTGTSPGTPLKGGVVLPINFDLYTQMVLAYLNSSLFDKFSGVIDSNGFATAAFTSSPLPASAIGLKMYYAFAVKYNPWYASNAVEVTIIP